jgi:hypothetical protein
MRDARFRLLILTILVAITAAIWTFPSWYPILNPNTVSISYIGLPLEAQADFALLPQDTKEAYFAIRDGDEDNEIDPNPAGALALLNARLLGIDLIAPDEVQLAEIPADAQTLRTGSFIVRDEARGATGDLIIYQTPDLRRYVRFENEFTVTRAPDIHIIFTRNPDPYDTNGVGVDYIDAGSLEYTIGTQTYSVPESVNFSQYPILALYSPSIDVVLSTATLR